MKTHLSNSFSRIAIVVLISLVWLSVAVAGEPQTVRLLTIGNSFSRNATHYLPDLAKAGGHSLIHCSIVVGGASLQLHAEKFQKFELDATDKAGCYTNGRSLKQELTADRWDFVTIQQASIKSHDIETYRPFAGQLRDYIKRHAPQAKLLVHQTWAYRCDDPRFTKPHGKPGEPPTREAMYRMLTNAYRTIAAELGARLIPVGDAFHLADSDPKWGYKPDTRFDFKNARPPALPNQIRSLHVGWQWKKDKNGKPTLSMDGHHANTAGEYLGACVWYEALFGESVLANRFVPKGLDPAYARFLRETAHRAVSMLTSQ
ncbi:MAG: DUF4886 domain-containing protein [Verrucomicrobiae bacterium]|nr:DUF4886 domain-containing protein [Verrucomicrobiae bacterium]